MTIPTEEQFLESMRALAAPIPEILLERFSWEVLRSAERRPAIELIFQVLKWQYDNFIRSQNMPALRWLCDDGMICRAREKMFSRWPTVKTSELSERILERLLIRYASHDLHYSDSYLRLNVVQSFIDDGQPLYIAEWYFGLLWAFREYHHRSETATDYLANMRHIDDLRHKVQAGIAAKNELASMLGDDINPRHLRLSMLYDREVKKEAEQMEFLTAYLKDRLPLKRRDGTIQERLLAFRIWQILKNIPRYQPKGRRPKASVIQSVLMMSGVKNQFDERNLERMCVGFNKTARPFSVGYLIHQIRDSYYRDEIERRR